MICKDVYLATAKKFFYLAEDFVEQIWLAAEQAMQKKSIQKPVLESKLPEEDFKFLMQDLDNYLDSQFTQEELQFLKSVIKKEIKYQQFEKVLANNDASYLYDLCNKEDSNDLAVGRFFTWMNNARTKSRKHSAKLAKLETVQRKIKKQLSIG